MVKAGYDAMNDSAQHPAEMAQEMQSAKQWQDNCMGQCHYSKSVTPTPNINIGGQRPDTPYNDQYVEGAWTLANGVTMIAGVGMNAASNLLRPSVIKPSTGTQAIDDLLSESTKSPRSNTTFHNSGGLDDGISWLDRITNGKYAKKNWGWIGDVDGGGTASLRPTSSTRPYGPTMQFDQVPGKINGLKIKFLKGLE